MFASRQSDTEVFLDALNLDIGGCIAACIVVERAHLVVNLNIELDFWLCARRTDRNLGTIGRKVLEYIRGGGEIHLRKLAGSDICAVEVKA